MSYDFIASVSRYDRGRQLLEIFVQTIIIQRITTKHRESLDFSIKPENHKHLRMYHRRQTVV